MGGRGRHARGKHYRVDHARIYNLPDQPPEIYVSGFGPKATELAARIGDGYINTSPDADLVERFKERLRWQAGPGRARRSRTRRPSDEGVGARAPPVAERRAAGRAGAGAADAASTSSRPAQLVTEESTRELGGRRRRPGRRTWSRSSHTPTPATTSCTSPTWARTTADMIEFYGKEILPALG